MTVLCNNPSCFTVDSAKGVIRAKSSVDMIVSRTNLNVADASDRDRFRIAISEEGSRLVCMSLFVLTFAVIIMLIIIIFIFINVCSFCITVRLLLLQNLGLLLFVHQQVIGKKDVSALLVSGVPEPRSSSSDSDQFQSVRAPSSHTGAPSPTAHQPTTAYEG